MDTLSAEKRHDLMASVKDKDTKPEKAVRSLLHSLGYRFRLHRKDLPGSPDIVLPKYRTVVFVHGCFWHRHPGCAKASTPKDNAEFWQRKFARNMERDIEKNRELETLGWRVLTVWECETTKKNLPALQSVLEAELKP